uniref:Protein pxr-1-like n=1 Tax=Crassostrea virginica TaxID=6565 RepID=A0A8B8B9M3_CRAVI|nr:protein pxr-1-like [Crassostrea virginica]
MEEETEESSATDTDKNSKAAKGKNKADSEAEGTPVRRGRRKGKGQLTDSESESPKEVGKRMTRSGKGKKGGRKGKGKVEEVEESGKGKGRGKKTKVEDSESEDDVPLVDIKKNKDSPMGKSKNKEEGNDTVQKVPQTPVQKIAQEKNSDDSPRSIFKMFESGLIQEGEQENLQASQQPVVSSLVTEVLELPITSGKNVGQSEDTSIVSDSAAPSSEIGVDDSVQSEVLTLECESKVEEVNYEDFITSMGEGSKPDPK